MAFESCGTLLLMESITQKFADLIFFQLMRDTSPRAKLRLTTTIVPDLPRRSFHTPWGASSKFLPWRGFSRRCRRCHLQGSIAVGPWN
jgi:hypothetical protein